MTSKEVIDAIVGTLTMHNVKVLNAMTKNLQDVADATEVMITMHCQDGNAYWISSDEELDVLLDTIAINGEQFVLAMENKFPNQVNW